PPPLSASVPTPRSSDLALVAVRPEVELQRLELDEALVGHVTNADRCEVGLAGPGAETGELRHRHRDLVVPVRVRVRYDLERLRRSEDTRLNSSHVAIAD